MLDKHVFFLENPTDAELEILYSNATALIAASQIEGFGLPIIEAAQHKLPALASDIPVFREVGGDGVIYFSLDSPGQLIDAIHDMVRLRQEDRIILASKVKYISWKESSSKLLSILENYKK
jgi:glycosyltransferase involved in cell wall biosynthesis